MESEHAGAGLAALVGGVSISAGLWAWSAAAEGRTSSTAWLAFVLVLVMALGGCWRLHVRRPGPFVLRWDGQAWWWRSARGEFMGEVDVSIDLGAWMLLRWHHLGGSEHVWLPVQRDMCAAHWHGLRCALYSPRPTRAASPLQSSTAAMTDLTP